MMEFFRDLIQRNLPTKIMSLLVAIVLWFFVMNDQNPSMDGFFTIPITYVGEPSNYNVIHSTDSVRVKVRGPRSLFVSSTPGDFSATVNINNFHDGVNSYEITTTVPYGLELLENKPEVVEVVLDPIVENTVPVAIILTGNPAAGMTVYNTVQQVTEAMVTGPKTAVDEVAKIIGYLNIDNEISDVIKNVTLVAVNINGREVSNVSIYPATTEATASLVRGLSRKVVAIKPNIVGKLPININLKNIILQPDIIEIAGNDDLLQGIADLTTEEISLSNVRDNATKRVKLILPEGITVTSDEVIASIEVEAANAR